MEKKPAEPPEVYCKTCYVVQPYTGQTHCTNKNCGVRFSNWHLAGQLAVKGQAQRSAIQN